MHQEHSLIKDVSDTAFMVAAYRARESERPDPLFKDSLAARLAGEQGRRIIENLPTRAFLGGWSVVVRTCIIDGLIQSALAEGTDTILNLGAGLDTRPYRMDLPEGLRWVEVDYPQVIELKEARLAGESPRCRLERVRLDLADGSKRRAFLREIAASSRKVLVLTEGVIPYLDPTEVAKLADDLRAEPAFAGWITDYFSPESYRYRRRKGMARVMKNAPFRFEPSDFFGFFQEHGWKTKTIRYTAEEGERLGRPLPLPWPARLWVRGMGLFLSRERRAELKRFMGYVLLERS